MTERDNDSGRFDRETLDAWETQDPPAGFAERVVTARNAESGVPEPAPTGAPEPRGRNPRWLKSSAVIVAIASAAVIVLALSRGTSTPGTAGSLRATERETVILGRRGVAVAEPRADIHWRVSGAGEARVEQTDGAVFYRVDPGGPFVVDTPAGHISVQGTCFTVEVRPMRPSKQTLTGAAVGAAVSATVLLTVYEGSVLFANDGGNTQIIAGQQAVATSGSMPRIVTGDDTSAVPAAPELAPPADDVSRDELLARDEAQRARIARIEQQLAEAQRAPTARKVVRRRGPGGPDDGDWLDPTQEQLAQFAKDCRVRIDAPAVFGPHAPAISPERAQEAGLTEQERVAMNKTIEAFRDAVLEEIRQLYIEATGDADGAEALSLEAMKGELRDKSAPGEAARVRRAIAEERAGLRPKPQSTEGMTPYERYFRLLSGSGDEFEAALGGVIGPERARALREEGGGFGMRMDMGGCPDGPANEDAQR
jgi:ferric-dicitrate binding protein FerR (iron transport regulator)